MATTRTEHDFIGVLEIPSTAYWGIHTARALQNFPISGRKIGAWTGLVNALGWVKQACTETNRELGVIDVRRADAICAACNDIIEGQLHDQFVVDVIQGGAGASVNMNANEVIANRALEHLGHPRGRYDLLHPNDHVNASQSTNDVYPTALRLAAYEGIAGLLDGMSLLRNAFEAKAAEFSETLKIGRTQLQDAVPMTLGQEFSAFAVMIGDDEARLREARWLIAEVNLGGTAIGTGSNAPSGYAERVVRRLAELTGIELMGAPNLVEATQDTGAFIQLSGVLKRVACTLSRICNDLRLLSCGPQAGFGDILLPARQAGSSFMPGKVNPVILEVVNQVAFEVIGHDITITMASEAGQLQLNAFEPIIGWSLHQSIDHLTRACGTLATNCVQGIRENKWALMRRVQESITVATALNPLIGYESAARIAKHALSTGSTIAAAAEALGVMSAADVGAMYVPEKLTQPGGPRFIA